MKIRNLKKLNDFIAVVNECKGAVWLESPNGDKFNLKSIFSQYLALGKLMEEHGEYLELTCSNADDCTLFLTYFNNHPEVQAQVD